jgi:lipoprotein-releasing system permease protein
MPVSLLIGRRAILSRENRLLINLTTWIAVLGVALGVAALIVVNAVYDGYIAEIQSRFISVLAHINISGRYRAEASVRGDADFLTFLEGQPGVVAAAPVISRQGLLMPRRSWNARRAGAAIFGLDIARARRVSGLLNTVTAGTGDPGPDEIVLGRALAERLGVGVGDSVVLLSDFDTSGRRPRVDTHELRVAGIFNSGSYQIDESLGYTSLATARAIFDVPPGAVDMVELKLDDPWHADEMAANLLKILPSASIRTWRDENRQFFEGVEITRWALLLILLLLVAVASTNVIGSLVMMVHDRTREIGILRAMGTTRGALANTFLLCGLFIGCLGVLVGLGFALLIAAALARWNLITIPESVYFIDHLPVVIDWAKVGLVALATLLVCLVASVVPALRAARLDPVEALRYE